MTAAVSRGRCVEQACEECGARRESRWRLKQPCNGCFHFIENRGEVMAVVLEELPYSEGVVRRLLSASDVEAINRGAIASPNLFLSLDGEARRILVRVFEKLCCQLAGERSMMAEPNTK